MVSRNEGGGGERERETEKGEVERVFSSAVTGQDTNLVLFSFTSDICSTTSRYGQADWLLEFSQASCMWGLCSGTREPQLVN